MPDEQWLPSASDYEDMLPREEVPMTCVDYRAHEAFCGHPNDAKPGYPNARIRFADGCGSAACSVCMFKLPQDVVEFALVDKDGIPSDERAWNLGDIMADLLRSPQKNLGHPQPDPTDLTGTHKCEAGACAGLKEEVRWYSREKILQAISLSQVRPSWTGYWFHSRCYTRWCESWRK